MRTVPTFVNPRAAAVDPDVARVGQHVELDDGYQLTARLGRGGMGDVWAARRDSDGGEVAVKMLHPHLASLRERVQREAGILALLPDGCAPAFLACGLSAQGDICLIMERLRGEDLGRRLATSGPLPVARALAIVTGVARVLDAVHALGVVHRDLKPSNVFLCEAGDGIDVRLLDFGIAQVSGEIDELVLTVSGDVVGSPGYLAPEQVLDDPSAVGPRTDVFALTALAYRLFTGHPAFAGRSLAAAAYQAAFVDPAPASGVCHDLPRALDRVLAHGLAKAPERRPGSAGEVAAALAAALGEPQR